MEGEICVDVHESNQISSDQKSKWIEELDEKFKNMKGILKKKQPEQKKKPEKSGKTIYKLPPNFMSKDFDDLYAPYKVSFGPYNHGKESCLSTEDIKEFVVLYSFERYNKSIYDYENALRKDLKNMKDKYVELDPKWQEDDEAFLKLMIYDGCFLLEILRAENDNILDSPVWDININDGIDRNRLMEYYKHDMLLLENQLPSFVLEKIFEVQTDKPKNFILEKIQKFDAQEYLNERIRKFFFPRVNPEIPTKKCLHVLDFYRHSLLYGELRRESKVQCLWRVMDSFAMQIISRIALLVLLFLLVPVIWVILALVDMIRFVFKLLTYAFKTQPATRFHFNFPSALDLDKVGVGFTSKTKGLSDISFGRRTLRLPKIYVNSATKSMFLKIIAFEKLHEDAENEVSSYIYFLINLIKGAGDVRHLQKCGVIVTEIRTPNEIVKLFNSLNKDIDMHDPESSVVPGYLDVSQRLINGFQKMNKPWQKDL